MRLVGCKPLHTAVWTMLVVKLNELFNLSLCLFNITKIYLPVAGKFFFYSAVYAFGYGILQRVSGLCHADLYLLFLQEPYIIMAAILYASVAVVYQRVVFVFPVFNSLFQGFYTAFYA